MAKYRYVWDRENKKKRYAGKYPDLSTQRFGASGENDAGQSYALVPKDAGIKREFIGSDSNTYTFYKENLGYYTVTATSFEDALRIAKTRGYNRKNYQKR